ncbi:hypothetical protein [Tritonibacter mobilis]|uniref:Uncharacterized protein n=1 Tax=Tritonibacter mobilis F1926 TaxID=1265309 RepID=A0A1B1A843_9RHOB|nr:hypothetical protein [Tritonibacter mobilis]ANP42745.1 hypothetical protein K529_018450 [Tritonibacter mobilis F1926]KJZ23416.1 hypothetical protein TW79_14150 [Tritonibacter mobilis]
MNIFPQTKVQDFSKCIAGEFIKVVNQSKTYAGLCVDDGEGKLNLLILETNQDGYQYMVTARPPHDEVLSYGTDWIIEIIGDPQPGSKFVEHAGVLLHRETDTLIVGRDVGAHGEYLHCELKGHGIFGSSAKPATGYAFEKWEIVCIDPVTSQKQTLAKSNF